MSPSDLIHILETFEREDFIAVANKAKRLIASEGASIKGGQNAVPTAYLARLYHFRARNPDLTATVADQTEEVARIASRCSDERWYLFSVVWGTKAIWIFASEAGIGRCCIDFGEQKERSLDELLASEVNETRPARRSSRRRRSRAP